MRFKSLIVLLVLSATIGITHSAWGQQTIYDDPTILYKREINGGIHIHGNGGGVFFTKSYQKTALEHTRWNLELVYMKHPKEEKRFHPLAENARGYFFGKKNSLIMLRPTIGRKKIFSEKYRKQGVSFATHMAIGPAIGFLKPVYIDYGYSYGDNATFEYDFIATEQFDIDKHSDTNGIIGRASFFKGIEDTNLQLGVHAKFGLDFEYSPYQTGIRGLETGVAIDFFPKEVEIMELDDVKNKQLFLSFYINLYFGKKYNNLDKG